METDSSQHAVDIEVTVANGKLDLGLFAPEDMLSLQKAEEVVAKLKEHFERAIAE